MPGTSFARRDVDDCVIPSGGSAIATLAVSGSSTAVGSIAPGSPVGSTAPVLMGCTDGTNARVAKSDASGNVQVRLTDGTNYMPTMDVAARKGFVDVVSLNGTTVVSGGVAGILAVGGNIAHSTATTANPVPTGGRVYTANDTTLVANDTSWHKMTTDGALYTSSFIPETSWSYAAASGGILNTTTAVTIKAAAGANIRNYITWITVVSEALTNATELAIRDGAAGTVLWRSKIGTAGWLDGREIVFATPLKGTANTLLEVVTLTASGAGAVYFNAGGYTAP